MAGEHSLALIIFRRSLDSLRQDIDVGGTPNLPAASSELTLGSLLRIPIATDALNDDDAASTHNKFCYYSRALWLKWDNRSLSPFDETILSIVILFNTALALHHRGLLIGTKSSSHLTKALGVYKMILSLVPKPKGGI